MEFIGSTVFDLPQPSPADHSLGKSGENSPLTERSGEGKYEGYAKKINLFLHKSLPQLVQAAQGHIVQHVVICHAGIPSDLRDELQSAAAQIPILLYLERDNFCDPVDLSKEMAGFRFPATPAFARYHLKPNDIVSLQYFDTISKYSGPEYNGMRLKLLGGLEGFWIAKDITVVRKKTSNADATGSVDIFATAEAKPELLILASPENKSTEEPPAIVDAATHSHLSLHFGRTKALWREPSIGDDAKNQVEEYRQSFVRCDFPVFEESLRFELGWPLSIPREDIADRFQFEFPFPVQSFTLHFNASSGSGVKKNGLVVSYHLIDENGEVISSDVDLKGIGRISNPEIGHCFIPDISGAESQILKHVRPPSGVRCKGITFIRRQEEDAEDAKIEIRHGEVVFDFK